MGAKKGFIRAQSKTPLTPEGMGKIKCHHMPGLRKTLHKRIL